jgi:hypothetical protein
MKLRTNVKAGALSPNHNEVQAGETKQISGLRVKTRIKAGALSPNHNETQVSDRKRK